MLNRISATTRLLILLCLVLLGIIAFQGLSGIRDRIAYQGKAFQLLSKAAYFVRDVGDFFYNLQPLPEEKLSKYYITISPENLVKMNQSLSEVGEDRMFSDDLRLSVPATFNFENKNYQIEVSYRGAQDIHWNADQKSYAIKFSDKEVFKENIKKLNLIIPLDRKYIVEHLNNYRAHKLGFFRPESHFVTVFINGKKHGVYFAQEGWSDEFLKKHGRSVTGSLYKTKDIRQEFCTNREEYYDCIKEIAGLWEVAAGDNSPVAMTRLKGLFDVFSIRDNDVFAREIIKYIELDHWLNWNVHYLLVQSYHQGITNLRFYYNPEIKKFEVVPWDVGMDMNHRHEDIVSTRDEVDIRYNPFVDRLLAVPEFRARRNELLWEYVKDDKNLDDDLKFYDQSFNEIRGDIYRDFLKRKSNVSINKDVARFRKNIVDYYHNLRTILKQGAYLVDSVLTSGSDYGFEVAVESFAGSVIEGVELNLVQDTQANFSLYVDSNGNNQFDMSDAKIKESKATGRKVVFTELNQNLLVPFILDQSKIRAVNRKRFFVRQLNNIQVDNTKKANLKIKNIHSKELLMPVS